MNEERGPGPSNPLRVLRGLVPDSLPVLQLALPNQVLLLLVAWVVGWLFGVRRPPVGCELGLFMALGLLAAGELAILALVFGLKPFVGRIRLPGYVQKLIAALRRSRALDLVVSCTLVGVIEEYLFRGTLVAVLGWLPTSLVFALAHRPRCIFHGISLSALGALFALETHLTGGLLVPMVHHALHDLLALGVLKVALDRNGDLDLFE